MSACPHCGLVHETTCPRIKAIEYQADGVTVKRIEFHAPPTASNREADNAILRRLAFQRDVYMNPHRFGRAW